MVVVNDSHCFYCEKVVVYRDYTSPIRHQHDTACQDRYYSKKHPKYDGVKVLACLQCSFTKHSGDPEEFIRALAMEPLPKWGVKNATARWYRKTEYNQNFGRDYYDKTSDCYRESKRNRVKEGQDMGTCPICNRNMISGFSIDKHHFIPKTFKGVETVLIHRICHQKLHATFTEREMKNHYHTIERLLEHEEVQKFVKWVSKKDPEFYAGSKETTKKMNKRRR